MNNNKKIFIEEVRASKCSDIIFHFLNGNITLKEFEYGAYAICPGCGSGKTTNIRNLISIRWHEGVLYSAFTKDECNLMYKWIVDNLVGTSINPKTGEVLKLEDIIVLHSDSSAPGVDNDLWRNNPTELFNKKIIICTHAKLLDEPIDLLVRSNFSGKLSDIIGPSRASLKSNGDLPRQWILIDESTETKCIKKYIRKSVLLMFSWYVDKENKLINESNGNFRLVAVPCKPRLDLPIRHYGAFKTTVKEYIKFNASKELANLFLKEDNELNKLRNEQVYESMFNDYTILANTNGESEYIPLIYSFTDIISDQIYSHVLLFDGTSDITLSNSSMFKVLSYPNKYNSQCNVSKFSFNLSRRIKFDKSINNIDEYMRDKLHSLSDQLESIIRQNKRTLIFTWMNFKSDDSDVNDEVTDGLIAETNSYAINKNMSIPSYLVDELKSRGLIEGEDFSIEYYGSGKDKAINDYRDYDAVVMCGNYRVPNSVISDFNLMFHTNITGTEYYANRAIQAICRTRIRKHNGDPINVYISSDWGGDTINYIKRYLKIDKIEGQLDPESIINIDYMYNELRKMHISPKKAEQIAKLSTLDENIFRAITGKIMYSTSLKLNDVYEIIPMTVKEVHKYRRILSSLLNYGVKLNIIK